MSPADLEKKAEKYLQRLCVEIPTRRVGSGGNRAATDFFAESAASFGFQTECPAFDCVDWIQEGAALHVEGEPYEVFPSPYSLGCQVRAPLRVVSSIAELEAVETAQNVLLLRGEIAREQLVPKNFPFYQVDEHQRIIQLLEAKKPEAILAATSRNPELAGAVYPFPLIEDGDFDIPSAYMTEEEGDRLAGQAGKVVDLESHTWRVPATSCNVIAHKGAEPGRRIVLTAHIDSKEGTPGALDNAAGVTALLLLAELLKDDEGQHRIEIVAINGEDYYSNPGEVDYLKRNQGKLGDVLLAINLDGVGYIQGSAAYSLYNCPEEIAGPVRRVFSTYKDISEGEPWYQGDHMLFTMNGVPALAITSERVMELMTAVVHTAQDRPELVDSARLARVAKALRELLHEL